MATEAHHIRRAYQTEEHQYDDRLQGFADGQLDFESIAQTGGADAAEDLPSKLALEQACWENTIS